MEGDVRRAVEWKIFEIQAGLISAEASEKYMELGRQWLQPRHVEEIVDERVSDGKCGYPLCQKLLNQSKSSSSSYHDIRKIYSSNATISHEILANYCSTHCCERGQRYLQTLDLSSPYTRNVVKTLDITQQTEESDDINAVLTMLCSEPPVPRSKSKSGERQQIHHSATQAKSNGADDGDGDAGAMKKSSNHQKSSNTSTGFISGSPRVNDQNWIETSTKTPPSPTPTTTPIPRAPSLSSPSVQSLYTPTLLSYDPIQNPTPGHTPLGLSPRPPPPAEPDDHDDTIPSRVEHKLPLKTKSQIKQESIGQSSSTIIPSTTSTSTSIASTILSLPVPDIPEGDIVHPVIQSRHLKKSLSFGATAVRVFKRGSYVTEYFNEPEPEPKPKAEAVKIPNVETPKVILLGSSNEEENDVDDGSVSENEDKDDMIQSTRPSFQNQLDSWLADWGNPSTSSQSNSQQSLDQLFTSTIRENIQPAYTPPEHQKQMAWIDPKPVEIPSKPSLTSDESMKAIKEAREKRKNNLPPSRQKQQQQQQQPRSSKIMKSKVVERNNFETSTSSLMKTDERKIEGYTPLISRDQIRVSPQTSLSGLAIQPFQLNAEDDTEETRINDDSILKELEDEGGEDKYEGEGEAEGEGVGEEEMDSIVKQNFFLYMWTCLEDLFGYETISWMNDLETQPGGLADNHNENEDNDNDDDDGENDETKLDEISPPHGEGEGEGEGEEIPQTRQILNIPSLHHDSSILKHLNRGINHVEKIMQIHSFLLKYHLNNSKTNQFLSSSSPSSSLASPSPLGQGDALPQSQSQSQPQSHSQRQSQSQSQSHTAHTSHTSPPSHPSPPSLVSPPSPMTPVSHDSINIYDLYLQQKKKLFSFIRLDETFNPSFNQKQWIFLSLLIIDAILCHKIFLFENISTSSNLMINLKEMKQNWNNKFNAYAAGILGGAEAANEILNERQILNLREFFTIETT